MFVLFRLCSWIVLFSMLAWLSTRWLTGRFVRNPVARKNLNHVLCGSHHRHYIQPNVNSTGHQTFLVNVAASKANREDWTNDRDRLEEFLGNLPGAALNHSFFGSW